MASGLSWFKFRVDAHSHPKLRSLSDGEFRLLTYIWGLAQSSSIPGLVRLTETAGVAPAELASGAGCGRKSKPEMMLGRLQALGLLLVSELGIITVHDWAEHNGVTPQALRMRRLRDANKSVTVTPPCASDKHEVTGDIEKEVEVEKEEERDLASPVPAPPPTPFTDYIGSAFPTCKRPGNLEGRAREAWPGVDILTEAKKARVWEEANPTKIKRNKAAFLARWFDKAQERTGPRQNGTPIGNGADKGRAIPNPQETRAYLDEQERVYQEGRWKG